MTSTTLLRGRVWLVALLACVAALTAAPASQAALCGTWWPPSQSTWTWGYTGIAYSNKAYWDATYAYDGSRFDSSMFATWSSHSNGGTLMFDNGGFSPYRNAGLYNNGTTQAYPLAYEENTNGSCY